MILNQPNPRPVEFEFKHYKNLTRETRMEKVLAGLGFFTLHEGENEDIRLYKAIFHHFVQFSDGEESYAVALLELPNGYVVEVAADKIKFLSPLKIAARI